MPISTLANDVKGCQVRGIVLPFDCCGGVEISEKEQGGGSLGTMDKKRKWDGLHLFWMQETLCGYKQHERKYT